LFLLYGFLLEETEVDQLIDIVVVVALERQAWENGDCKVTFALLLVEFEEEKFSS